MSKKGTTHKSTSGISSLEAEQLDIERQKLSLEHKKVEIELSKAKWTAISISVPVFAAVLTVAFGFWSTWTQAKFNFQAKAAEIVMQSATPVEAKGKALFFKALFKDQFPKFAEDVDENRFQNDNPAIVASKKELFRAVVDSKTTAQQAVNFWRVLFPDDDWAKEQELDRILANQSK